MLQFGDVMITLKIATGLLALLMATNVAPATNPKKLRAVKTQQHEVECLAKNIYHEARGESFYGQVAVALVTVNRVASGQFQSSICKVVYAEGQFSWTQSESKRAKESKAWSSAMKIATAVLSKTIEQPEFTALYFHTAHVRPKWAKTKTLVARIGSHLFYS